MNRLFTRYLNSAAFYDGNNDKGSKEPEKTPNEIERDKILATMNRNETEDNNNEGEKKEEQEENEDAEASEEDEEADEENESDKDGGKNENETDEQKKERIAKEKQERKEKRMQRRIDRLTAENSLTKKERDDLKKKLEAKPDANLTEEEVQSRAERLAEEIVAKRNEDEGKKLFQKDCDTLQEAATKVDKDFDKKINEVAADVGPIPQIMIGILAHNLDNENGGDVLAYLADNPEEYEDIYNLREGRMTAKLIRISDKLKAEKDAAEKAAAEAAKNNKKKSKLPEPITPIQQGRDASTNDSIPANPTQNMEQFVRVRNQQEIERRKARGGL